MKQLFHITSEQPEVQSSDVLLMEVGEDYSCFAKCSASSKQIQELQYFSTDRFAFDELHDIWQQTKSGNRAFQKVVVCSAFPKALLVPEKFYSEEQADGMLQTMYPVQEDLILKDAIRMWKLYTVYAIPKALHEITAGHFSEVEYIHAYSTSLRTYNSVTTDSQLFVQFNVSSFRVKVKKEQKLILMQTFSFQTPLDVVYILLKICAEMNCKQEDTPVTLSGLIDADSDLYKELYNYFIHLRFASFPDHIMLQSPYPSHFFASLYNLAACVL